MRTVGALLGRFIGVPASNHPGRANFTVFPTNFIA
jgi:hypothetical protein